jgi:hypothetical protein
MLTPAARAHRRITEAEDSLLDYKLTTFRFRRLGAGDYEALIEGQGVGVNQDRGFAAARAFRNQFPDILVQRFAEGRSNAAGNLIETLVKKVAYNIPSVKIDGIKPKEQIVNAQYLSQKLGPKITGGCNAIVHEKMALMDYLMGGLGTTFLPIGGVLRYADTLDMKWDQTARFPCDMKWASVTVCQPCYVFMEMFPNNQHLEKWAGKKQDSQDYVGDDRPTEMEFYYDCEGRGAYICFLKIADAEFEKEPIYQSETPHYSMIGAKKVPFLPFETMSYMSLPSVRNPTGLFQKLLPAQIALWESDKHIRSIIKRGKSFYEVDTAQVTPEDLKKFEQALDAGIVKVTGKAFNIVPALEIDKTTIEYRSLNSQELTSQSGVSNNSQGAKIPGVETATEARQIQQSGELTAAVVSQAVAAHWSTSVTKILWNSKNWDTEPFKCYIDDQLMEFGPKTQLGPIKEYLRPDGRISVQEDAIVYRSRQQQLAEAQLDIQVSSQLAQMGFPNAIAGAARDFYEALGRDDIEERLEKPQPQQVPGQMPGQPMSAAMQGEAQGAPQ